MTADYQRVHAIVKKKKKGECPYGTPCFRNTAANNHQNVAGMGLLALDFVAQITLQISVVQLGYPQPWGCDTHQMSTIVNCYRLKTECKRHTI